MSRKDSQPEQPLNLLPDEWVLWTGHSTCGDGATWSAFAVLFGTVTWIGRWAFGAQWAPGTAGQDWAFPALFGLTILVCVIVMVLIRPFRRAGYAITTQRVIFVHRDGVTGRYFHGIESHVSPESPTDFRLTAHAGDSGTILFRGSGKNGVDLALSRIADAQRVYLLLQAVQSYWATGARQRAELPTSQCLGCGYSLIGNVSGRCPECGQVLYAVDTAAAGPVAFISRGQFLQDNAATGKGNVS